MRLELMIPLFAAMFFIVWIGVLYVIAHLGPWSLLAQQFPVDEMTQGTRYWFASLQSGLASYRSCVNVIASEDRMTVSVMWPFRPFHPPITFPRSARCRLVDFCSFDPSHFALLVGNFDCTDRLSSPLSGTIERTFFDRFSTDDSRRANVCSTAETAFDEWCPLGESDEMRCHQLESNHSDQGGVL